MHEVRTERNGLDLLQGEHQRRQVKPLAQHIAETRRSFDGNTPRLQRRDIAIDGAHRHFQALRQGSSRHRLRAAPQGLDDIEQAIGAAHASPQHP